MEYHPLILIGGATGVGTSSLAMRLGTDIGVQSVIGTDSIREIMRAAAPGSIYLPLTKSTYNQYEDIRILNENILQLDEKNKVIAGYKLQASVVNVGISALLDRYLAEDISIIIEGIHILPDYVDDRHISRVIPLIIDVENPAVHRERIRQRGNNSPDRAVGKQLRYFPQIRIIRDYLVENAEKHGIPVIQNGSLDDTVKECMNHIQKTG